jgi:hypothetical protein
MKINETKEYEVEVMDSNGEESSHSVLANNIAEARFIARNLHVLDYNYKSDRLPVITTLVIIIQN